ncbi:hypothetical protein [Pedobacter duraquae]|uniref:Uncharacterized protein n=1 Tax=Pedobacter duraquae TaxID=425511 RepID=A0A4R6IJ21_9SPHI|nr:hypothetical protein [Pedobacter duraquae]TDO21925.1 hypothetical protein CLV32_3033 [Pedobacter duraquae]
MKKRILEYKDEVMTHYETGITRGVDTGFKTLDEILSFKLGYSTFYLGFAGAGKTEVQMEMLFNQSEKHSWKHALMSGEIGNSEDVIAELISKRLRKPFFKSNPFAASEAEVYKALAWLDHHFFLINGDDTDHTIESVYDYCESLEKEFKMKLQSTSIDPFNDLEEDLIPYGGREDKYLAWALKRVRQKAKTNNWHNNIVTHAKDLPPIILKDITGQDVYCTSVPTLNSFAGGAVWGRRAFNVVGVWRPEHNNHNGVVSLTMNPSTGTPFAENEAILKVLKVKPKGTAKKGSRSLFFDWKQNRYYEEVDGSSKYAFEHELNYDITNPNAGMTANLGF